MSTMTHKLATLAVVLAVVAYWCWPALRESYSGRAAPASNAAAKKPAAPRELSASTLTPALPPPSQRDPFLLPGVKRSAKVARSGPSNGKTKAVPKTIVDIKDSGLVLGATYVADEVRLALINGRVYKEQDTVQPPGEAAKYVITDILPLAVLLSRQGKSVRLNYLDAAKSAAKEAAKDGRSKPAS
jgi:hypothetical protein